MQPIHSVSANPFTGSPLDRMDARRRDPAWVRQQLDDEGTAFVPVWRARNLVRGDRDAPAPAYISQILARPMLDRSPWAVLGRDAHRAYVALDLSALDAPLPHGEAYRFEDLRRVGGLLPAADAAMLAHARGLMHWRTRNRYCSTCGAGCVAQSAGHVMACEGCGAHHFPRTDPAVIMLVTRGSRALLGQPARFRDTRIFTTLAGFVEPGESLEEAVAREVHEEAAIRVGNVRYHSSQPWPFPASVMLGFTAEAEDDAVTVDPHELVEARWFTRDEIRNPVGFVLPPPMSIARRLIRDWVENA